MSNITYIIIGIVLLVVFYYIYKKVKRKIMVNKDYNRKISKGDLKVRKDLQILRNQLFQSEDPGINNEILNKIQAIVKATDDRKGEYDK